MKIKDFLKNFDYYCGVEFLICHEGMCIIYTDTVDVINDYGDKELKSWTIENSDSVIITLYLN